MKKKSVSTLLLVLMLSLALGLSACHKQDAQKSGEEAARKGEGSEAGDKTGTKDDEAGTKEEPGAGKKDQDGKEGEEEDEGSEGGIEMNTVGAGINYLEARYDGTISGEVFSYKIEKEGDTFYFIYEDISLPSEEGLRTEIGREVLEELRKIYDELEIEKWNGFNKRNKDVMDGHGFSLTIGFDNGERLNASGYNYSPDHYWEFREELAGLFQPYIEELMEAEKERLISKGVSGKLNYVLANFQKPGGDQYEINLIRDEGINYNLDIHIKSLKGEFFEEGDYLYYTTLPLEALNFVGIEELIEKYDIIKWYGWDKASKDSSTSEWFQLGFEFDDGRIDAQGTEHPENYEAFRRDFLKLIAAMIEEAKANYGLEVYPQ